MARISVESDEWNIGGVELVTQWIKHTEFHCGVSLRWKMSSEMSRRRQKM